MPESSVLLHHATATPTTTHPHITSYHHHNNSPATNIPTTAALFHVHSVNPNQSCSIITQHINAPIAAVWSIVRRFDCPQSYKHFIKTCEILDKSSDVVSIGSLRRVNVISGLPAATSMERLEILDDESHVISFSVVGGDHRLSNYRSVTTLHSSGEEETVVVESYVVDTPAGNTKDETCVFVDTIVRCNLQSLAHLAENSARREIGI